MKCIHYDKLWIRDLIVLTPRLGNVLGRIIVGLSAFIDELLHSERQLTLTRSGFVVRIMAVSAELEWREPPRWRGDQGDQVRLKRRASRVQLPAAKLKCLI
jgi:hypothetical protein